MGKLHHTRCMETAMRLARYLGTDTVVSEQVVSGELKQFCVSSPETAFETAVANLYTDRRYHRHRRFLMKRWRILDWLHGPPDERLARHNFLHGQHHDDAARRAYYTYLTDRDFLYQDAEGRTYTKQDSRYNEHRLEQLLPEADWARAQVARHGPDYRPGENYDRVKYTKPPSYDGLPAPPPAVAEWLLQAARGTVFGRNPEG